MQTLLVHMLYVCLQAFPSHACFKIPILIIAIVGAVMLFISAAISFLQSVAATELDPDSKDLLAMARARYTHVTMLLLLHLHLISTLFVQAVNLHFSFHHAS